MCMYLHSMHSNPIPLLAIYTTNCSIYVCMYVLDSSWTVIVGATEPIIIIGGIYMHIRSLSWLIKYKG